MRQPFQFLFLGTALQQRLGQNFRTCNQTARRAQRTTGQFFRDHDHAQIVFLLIALDAAEAFRDGNTEAAQILELIDNRRGNVEIVAVNFFGQGHHHFFRDAPEGFTHHLVMIVQQISASDAALSAH